MPDGTEGNQEPTGALERLEYYRGILDQLPEYHPLTRSGQQAWTAGEIAEALGGLLSEERLMRAVREGLLPGAIPGAGRASTMIPRSALVLYLGRLVTGYYRQARADGGEKAASQ